MLRKTTLLTAMSALILAAATPIAFASDRHDSRDKAEHSDRHDGKSGDRGHDRHDNGGDKGSKDSGGDR